MSAQRPRMTHVDGSPVRALVVDDEPSLCDILAMALRHEGWQVETAITGQDAIRTARSADPDVIVLDIMLPDIDGLTVLQRLRESGVDAPVLFLTAKDSLDDRLAGLDAGGDDYVTKPFNLGEVVARLQGLVRRTAWLDAESTGPLITVGDLSLDEDSYEVARAGVAVELSPTEFQLLRFLMRNPRRVHSKAQILDNVWDYDYDGRSTVVDLYISYLRRKIDTLGPPMIHTIRGVGYMLKPAADG
ncbi:response regulator transcription factor [Microbacterium sp. ARD32]|uniref:response regulator transcription factor n=1 Tax=Microbacterium sp. ARD32 TaxID=2962577 RepID=UPI00288212A4|nr:response regulator transcription factor [Microbacterium sp. ARD32]MDT0156222.1 response regulator transcription factor [Microbacterium sp. ARD32]